MFFPLQTQWKSGLCSPDTAETPVTISMGGEDREWFISPIYYWDVLLRSLACSACESQEPGILLGYERRAKLFMIESKGCGRKLSLQIQWVTYSCDYEGAEQGRGRAERPLCSGIYRKLSTRSLLLKNLGAEKTRGNGLLNLSYMKSRLGCARMYGNYLFYSFIWFKSNIWNVCIHHQGK